MGIAAGEELVQGEANRTPIVFGGSKSKHVKTTAFSGRYSRDTTNPKWSIVGIRTQSLQSRTFVRDLFIFLPHTLDGLLLYWLVGWLVGRSIEGFPPMVKHIGTGTVNDGKDITVSALRPRV